MIVTPVKTRIVETNSLTINSFLEESIDNLKENTIVVITSKVISLLQGRVVEKNEASKDELVKKESSYYLDALESKYNFSIAIKNGHLVPSAGIDESNGNNVYILWPEELQKTANKIREFLCDTFQRKYIGVLITDSTTRPLRYGTTGVGIAHSGFEALKDYIGKEDIFGRRMEVTKMNVLDGLAASAVVTMGEGAEVTPVALITDVPFVTFVGRNPTNDEINSLEISKELDLYEPLLTSVKWKKGDSEE